MTHNARAVVARRRMRGWRIVERLLADLRSAVRMSRKTPGLTATIIVTLALGVGVTLASFSLVDTLVTRPLGGVRQPGALVRISGASPDGALLPVSSAMIEPLRQLPAFAAVCGVNTPGNVVTVDDQVRHEGLLQVSATCFDLLGVTPHLGRLLHAEDDRQGARVAVLTHEYWQRMFGGDPQVLGRTLAIDGEPFSIVGVTEPAFRGLSTAFPASISIPSRAVRRRGTYWCEGVARLAPGVSLDQARAQVSAAWPHLLEAAGASTRTGSTWTKFRQSRAFVGDMRTGIENALRPLLQQPLLVTFGLSVLMLVLACANVANLLVARALTRRRDLAVRAALGATRADLWRQSLLETVVPVAAGTLLAVPVAQVIVIALVNVLRSWYRTLDLPGTWNARLLLFLLATGALLTLIGGVVQIAATRSRTPLVDLLRASARTTSAGNGRTRRLLVAAQVALTVMLVGSAGTFVRTLQQYYAFDPGFAVDRVLAAQLVPLPGGYATPPGGAYYADLLARVEAIPGARAASLTTWLPLGAPSSKTDIEPVPARAGVRASGVIWTVSDRFFESAGVPLKEGRTFSRSHAAVAAPSAAESTASPPAATAAAAAATAPPDAPPAGARTAGARTAVLSESLARQLFPGTTAIGARLRVGPDAETQDVLVIGVAADARLGRPQRVHVPVLYLNFWEDARAQQSPYLLVRAQDERPELLASAASAAVRGAGREFTLWTRSTTAQWHAVLASERLVAGTSALFGLMALVIVAVGLFGLLSHYVTTRRAEIAIRIAVGAHHRHITRLLAREVAGLLLFGAAAGGLLLYLASRTFAGLLAGAVAADLWLVAMTAGLVGAVTLIALALPLRRATAIDPLIALRTD